MGVHRRARFVSTNVPPFISYATTGGVDKKKLLMRKVCWVGLECMRWMTGIRDATHIPSN